MVAKGEMAENGPVRGTMVIRPYGWSIWERMQAEMDARIKDTGAQNAYFPLFIPLSYFQREAEHVEGFSPELAVVTHAGGEDLAEPIVVRPTSETVIGEYMAKWIQSYRDLPLLLNQWSNVVRWELRPRLFLRSSEFLWQEGHTAHASYEDANAFATKIHLEVYNDFLENIVAAPSHLGIKPASERFPGAINSMTAETMMRDGKALQMATTHELGQNFARAFDIYFQSEAGQAELCFTSSWGASTRMVGGLIMLHGDDNGLVVPPRLAPIQVVVIAVRDEPEVSEACDKVAASLKAAGVRVQIDRGRGTFGRRVTDWEIKGVPLRVEVGPRDSQRGCRHAGAPRRRREGARSATGRGQPTTTPSLLGEIQVDMFNGAKARLTSNTHDVASIAEAIEAAETGFARLDWSKVGDSGEAELKVNAITVRCLQRRDGSMPQNDTEDDLVCIVAKSY